MDVVYIVKNNPKNDSEELRYSLRSLKNFPHENVIIAGEKPDWVTNVTFVPVTQDGKKGENSKNNLIAAVAREDISESFVMMNDDFFIMKPITAIPTLNLGTIRDRIKQYESRYPEGSSYTDSMRLLDEKLRNNGISDPISYELHTPFVLSKNKVQQIYRDVVGPTYMFRSYYGNSFSIGGDSVSDVKVFLESKHNSKVYQDNPMSYLQQQYFLSTTGGSFSSGLAGDFVRSQFAEKSEYEL